MVKIVRLISVISLTLISGCGTARVIIDEPPLRQYSSSTIYTESKSTTVGVPVKLLQHFDESLNKELAKSFSSGKGLLFEYRFLSFDEGNQVKRYLAGESVIGERGAYCWRLPLKIPEAISLGRYEPTEELAAVLSVDL